MRQQCRTGLYASERRTLQRIAAFIDTLRRMGGNAKGFVLVSTPLESDTDREGVLVLATDAALCAKVVVQLCQDSAWNCRAMAVQALVTNGRDTEPRPRNFKKKVEQL